MAKITKAALAALLLSIVGFGPDGGYVEASDALNELVKKGFAEIGPANAEGKLAVRATTAGVEAAKQPEAVKVNEAPAVRPSFTIVSGVAPPEAKRGGNKGQSIYPFEQMQPGQSFFIPATAEMPEPWKALASTATSATRRYDELLTENGQPVMETVKVKGKDVTRQKRKHTRIFAMRPIQDGAPWGHTGVKGAGVFRTQ